jgi:hypothetical protein
MMLAASKYYMGRAVRRLRREALSRVRNGSMPLVVYGNQHDGYQLGGDRPWSVVLFSRVFSKQREAIAYGQEQYGQTAKKVTQTRRKAA